jgi:hypothetical protein
VDCDGEILEKHSKPIHQKSKCIRKAPIKLKACPHSEFKFTLKKRPVEIAKDHSLFSKKVNMVPQI